MASEDTSSAATDIEEFLARVSDALGLEAEVKVEEDEESISGTLVGDDLGLVIGRHGQTIDALQHLASRIAFKGGTGRKRVVIDAAGYREKRAEILQRQADKAVEEAVEFARPVALDAMAAAERRVVHEYLRDRHEVETYSEGEEPDRHLVVAPVVE